MIAEVLFPLALDDTFYYEIPKELEDKIKPGVRIYASFAKMDRALGYVISVFDKREVDLSKFELKKIDKIIDKEPPFVVEKFIEISEFISSRWFSTKGMILRDFLRYLPKKLELRDRKSETRYLAERRFIVSSNILSDMLDFICERYKKIPIVVFFPNIFSLKVFERKLQEKGILDFLSYSSEQRISLRKKITQRVLLKDFDLILSTKSGVHLPFSEGICFVVAEPLNHMYRQFDQHPYYETVELLMKISEVYNCSISLFSASISPLFIELEKEGKVIVENKAEYQKVNINIFDFKKNSPLSEQLMDEIERIVEGGGKVLFISYSRYSSSITFCPVCGLIKRCGECGGIMRTDNEVKRKIYLCPYCGKKEEYSNFCENCKTLMVSKGYGSQRIFEELLNRFHNKRIILIDGRIVHIPQKMESAINFLHNKNFDIISATEIAATHILDVKFDLIIMSVYESQNTYDYSYAERFLEKLKNLLGILKENGKINIYTYNPTSFIFTKISDFEGFIKEEIELRKKFGYPPYAFMYDIEITSSDKKLLKNAINDLIEKLSNPSFAQQMQIISFDPSLKLRKIRNEKNYIHLSSIRLKDYKNFFLFLNDFAAASKLKVNVVSR